MPFPFLLKDHSGLRAHELARINPDASITVLDWERVIDWSCNDPFETDGLIVGLSQVLCAARFNFVETTRATSDRSGADYQGETMENRQGNIGCQIYDDTLTPIIVLKLSDFKWQVNWRQIETGMRKYPVVTNDTALFVGLMRLFYAAKDNFVTHKAA
jgi:hypothetical protein